MTTEIVSYQADARLADFRQASLVTEALRAFIVGCLQGEDIHGQPAIFPELELTIAKYDFFVIHFTKRGARGN